jgi:hypothetical protein
MAAQIDDEKMRKDFRELLTHLSCQTSKEARNDIVKLIAKTEEWPVEAHDGYDIIQFPPGLQEPYIAGILSGCVMSLVEEVIEESNNFNKEMSAASVENNPAFYRTIYELQFYIDRITKVLLEKFSENHVVTDKH